MSPEHAELEERVDVHQVATGPGCPEGSHSFRCHPHIGGSRGRGEGASLLQLSIQPGAVEPTPGRTRRGGAPGRLPPLPGKSQARPPGLASVARTDGGLAGAGCCRSRTPAGPGTPVGTNSQAGRTSPGPPPTQAFPRAGPDPGGPGSSKGLPGHWRDPSGWSLRKAQGGVLPASWGCPWAGDR